ncbi:hypothetical protein [Bacteroides neonati]|uniref:hypothetical protein n=1 Tax=Bacteroides neonati TaxID=1347393 RepID=UPI0004B1D9ED|nr:hypothetical protein [Bacteroides neonati]
MRDIKSMILGNDNGGDKAKLSTAPVVQKEESKPSEQILSNPDPTLPVSSNGYAQAAARVNAVNDAIQGKAQVDKPDVQATALPSESTSSDQPKFRSAGDIVDEFYKKQLPSEEELIKEKKREKSRAVISAIADGVSAFSNLYFTGKGAQNVEQTSMSAANAKRYQAILDKRMKVQDEWGRSRLAAYDRDRVFDYQKGRDDANWKRSGEWHDDQVKTENSRFDYNKARQEKADADNKEYRDKNYELNKKSLENQEKAQKDASARGWASVSAQNKRIEAQDRKQKEYSKYQFEKANGAPEPKRIGEKRSIYVGRNTWEQNSGQIAGEIYKDLLSQDAKLAKEFYKSVNGGYGKKSADAKQTAALVDKYIMRSPRAQQLALEVEKDYRKRYEMAGNNSTAQTEDDPYAKYSVDNDPFAQYAE